MAITCETQVDFSDAVVNAMRDGVAVCHAIDADPHVRFTVWNSAMAQLTGYTLDEINQLGWYQTVYIDPPVQELARLRMERMRQGEHLVREEWLITRKDGTRRNVEISTSTVAQAGAASHVMAVMRDTTEYKLQLQHSASNFQSFFDTIDDFLFVLDQQGNILFVNQVVINRLGYAAADLAGQSVLSVHPEARRQEVGEIVAGMLAGSQDFCHVPLMAANGTLIPVETRVVQGNWNGQSALFGVSRDVTERIRINQALQDEAARRKILFDQSRDGVALLRTNGSLAECNPAFAESLGYSVEELLGMHVWDWDSQMPRTELEPKLREPGRRHLTLETRHRRKNGSHFDVAVSVNDVEWAGERYFFCIHQDITARKLAQEQLRESEFFLRESQRIGQLGGWRADPVRNSVMWTQGVYDICEYPPDYQPDLETALDAYLPPYRQRVMDHLQQVLEKATAFSIQVQVKGAQSGDIKWTELRGFPHFDAQGKVDYAMGTLQDISERKHVEIALAKAKEDAEAANRAKSAFLATMSHEIRTPMNGVLGMAQLLLMPNLSASERCSYARTILSSGQTLLALLNDILDLSKIEAGKFQLENTIFDPQSVLTETSVLFCGAAQSKNLQLDAQWLGPAGQRYKCDAYRVRQMLANLVGNAIKFTPAGSIQVQASEFSRDGEQALLMFSVSDTGIGVASDKLDLLFKPFSQTDSSTTREFGGSGLGLSIVYNLAKAMGGRVGVQSQLGKGSKFWFEVQTQVIAIDQNSRSADRESARPVVSKDDSAVFSGTVLVAEDNLVNCMVIESLLTKLGLKVIVAHDGQLALDALAQGARPDLVLMDLHMPVLDGYSATQQLRHWSADKQPKRLPVIALTADAFEEDRRHCMAVGMDDFLTKPIAIAELTTALGQWLPRAR